MQDSRTTQYTVSLSPEESARVRARLQERGSASTAKSMGIGLVTLLRAAAGETVHRATRVAILDYLERDGQA